MTKRYLVVHDCGHIVQPGDRIKLADNDYNKRNPLAGGYNEYEFVGLATDAMGRHSYKFLIVIPIDSEGLPDAFSTGHRRRVERFDCSIVEVDYDEQAT